MKLPVLIAAALLPIQAVSQDLSGKWYGKITQGPGGYASEYSMELDIRQHNQQLSGISFAYFNEEVVARFSYYGFFEGDDRIILQEDRLLKEKTPPQWIVCIKRMALAYRRTDSVEYLEGEWAGIGISDGEACVPGKVYLSKTPNLPEMLPVSLRSPGNVLPPGDRLLKEGNNVTVKSPDIVVKIVDYQILDGDTVSVYFDEEKVVDRQVISKDPIVLHLKVENPGRPARLLLYAENLGRIPPNTALMIVEDRKGRQRIKLESDYERSDVIYLRYKK